ncbi:ParB/RepB/Spo0J family partition protein [Vibrio mediterranei]|uniref:ParB/RepB/Spo0J family partition protein n=1 Tax=Vibrio mediterranei TaxID=689 RepID=UPI001EFD06D3|nr:ParB/RepB/Spo0J family partition protein [Vibrio mediterranei]MCG9660894.1 ParB/RepB/Spo0J family partition protein [Vibrio mediterranei]
MAKRSLHNVTLFDTNDNKDIDDVVMMMPERTRGESLMEIPLGLIDPDPNQPRKTFTEEDLDGLFMRIQATNGRITKPIDVRPNPDDPDRFLIKDGEMRWRVYQTRTEHATIASRVITKDKPAVDTKLEQLMANVGNVDMILLDVARGIEEWRLGFEPPKTKKEAAEAFGWNQTKMTRLLKLIDAPTEIQEMTGKVRNLNTLNSMIQLHKADKDRFAQAMSAFLDESFDENPESFWQQEVREVKAPAKSTVDTTATQTALTEQREAGNSVSDPAGGSADEDTTTTKPAKKDKTVKPVSCPLEGVSLVKGKDGIAVLQLSYLAGKETLSTEYQLSEALMADLQKQINEYTT